MKRRWIRVAGLGVIAGAATAAGAYASYASAAWLRYGRVAAPPTSERDPLLDRFLPKYEIVERHHVRVEASPAVALAAARDMDIQQSRVVRAVVRGRECALGAHPDKTDRPRGLLAYTRSLGWGILAEVPDREVVVGAVTQPWNANVVFRAVPAEDFADFAEPGYVKIVWTLRADSDGDGSIVRTETRAMTTDATARRRFRRYWSIFSPGIVIIRHAAMRLVKRDAERRARSLKSEGSNDLLGTALAFGSR